MSQGGFAQDQLAGQSCHLGKFIFIAYFKWCHKADTGSPTEALPRARQRHLMIDSIADQPALDLENRVLVQPLLS